MKIKIVRRVLWRMVLALVMFGGGAVVAVIGNYAPNMMLIMLGIGIAAGGVLLFFRTRNLSSARIIQREDGTEVEGLVNALVMGPGYVGFKHVQEPLGHEQRCINDGKWYHVMSEGADKKLEEYKLPEGNIDQLYYDPKEFANVVSMPANQKLFEPLPSMAKTIAVGIMGIVVIGLAIVILAMVG